MFLITGQLINENTLIRRGFYNLNHPDNANIDTSQGVEVEFILDEPQPKRGFDFIHYVNPQTKEQWYEEVDGPLDEAEKIDVIKEQSQIQQRLLDDLLLNIIPTLMMMGGEM